MAQPTLVAENLIADIGSLNKRIEHAKQENESIRTKIQEVAHSKGGSALPAAIEACVKENIGLYKAQERQTALEKKAAVKEDILMHLKSKKCTWANDKNCERKSLLSILNIGLNVLEISGGEAKVEFVVDTKRIVTRYRCAEEKFSRE